jgi:hypothetical protein
MRRPEHVDYFSTDNGVEHTFKCVCGTHKEIAVLFSEQIKYLNDTRDTFCKNHKDCDIDLLLETSLAFREDPERLQRKNEETELMGWMKHKHHEEINRRPEPYNHAAEEHADNEKRRLAELKRQKDLAAKLRLCTKCGNADAVQDGLCAKCNQEEK